MAKQIMLVNVHEDETRIAIIDRNVLVGLHVQQTDRQRKVGNIYKGRIVKINPAFQAAFVDYGDSRNGFLSISDVNFNLFKPRESEKGRPKIQHLLREGQSVMVQILKEGLQNKGSALTTFVSLAGRYLVISPNSERSGVSRRIESPDARRHLRDVMDALTGEDNFGVIIRTAGIDRPVADLQRDLEGLRKQWRGIEGAYEKARRPGLLHQEPSPIVRVLRDYFTPEVQEVWVDDAEGFQEALGYFKTTLPKFQKRLKLYVGDTSLFSAYRIEEQIQALDSSRVPLPSGGSLVIESTEALVSVDVNSGRSNQASDIEDTALNTNQEAAHEIARQLRLRNLGGLIVIDFIDMVAAKNRKLVEKTVADALRDDKARTTIGNISQFGLLELSRQRIDMELSRGLRVQCPNCGGTGHIPTVNSSANNVLRKIRELAATGRYSEIHGELPLDAANFLLNEKREALRDLELEFEITLKLEANAELPAGHPISLHGARPTESGDAAPETVTDVDAPEAESEEGEDGGRRRRRRRRRRRPREREEFEGREQTVVDDLRDDAGRGSDEGVQWDEEPLAADEDLDEDSEVEEDMEPVEETEAPDPLVEGEHAFVAPHAEIHAEPGVIERRPQVHPPVPAPETTNGSGVGLVFRSAHNITDPEAVEKLPPRIVRSSPFQALAADMPPNTVVYDSAASGAVTAEAPAKDRDAPPTSDAGDDEAKPARKRRARGGSRRRSAAAGEPGGTDEASQDAAAAADDSGAEATDAAGAADGNAKQPAGRRRRGGGGRSRKTAPKDAAADEGAATPAAEAPPAADGAEAKPKRSRPSGTRSRGRGGARRKPGAAASSGASA